MFNIETLTGFEAERALTECQNSGQEVRVSERRGADAETGVMLVTKWANPSLFCQFKLEHDPDVG